MASPNAANPCYACLGIVMQPLVILVSVSKFSILPLLPWPQMLDVATGPAVTETSQERIPHSWPEWSEEWCWLGALSPLCPGCRPPRQEPPQTQQVATTASGGWTVCVG